ncbi:zinc-ribbon domain-containing protein [Lentibacillus sediminis]|uniref:zinc-ribbon domain-containing protein n=1 Tax=Lentibacillus sediminis TaxID=1940529 RepID=UPI000C1BA55A|nr:zinc-ribbon domain-containing protein [Lentibacillus sediminis]
MRHCPYCGTMINEDEQYCIKCGKALPNDIDERLDGTRRFNKFWYLPLSVLFLVILSSGIFYVWLDSRSAKAEELYYQGADLLMQQDYEAAGDLFAEAVDRNGNFTQANVASEFMKKTLQVQQTLEKAAELSREKEFQEALSMINTAENSLKNYNGTAVNQLIDVIVSQRETIKVAQLKSILREEPGIDQLKRLLWEADELNHQEAEGITESIRNQIIDYSFSKASAQLNNKHFNDARLLVEDGLKYAPNSEKLTSLQTTVEKEQTAFETAQQQRIEQAVNAAAQDHQLNETDAIELLSAEVEQNEQGNFAVEGEVKSVATIPVHSILVEYSLLNDNDTEVLSNEVYVYPDKLYPDENGEFEFTHFDISEETKGLQVEIDKVTWYTE